MLVACIQRPVALQERLQHEGLEEPAYMCQVPFGRAHLRCALDDIVLTLQWFAQAFGGCAYRLVMSQMFKSGP